MLEVYSSDLAIFFYIPEVGVLFSIGRKNLNIKLLALDNIYLPTRFLLEKRNNGLWVSKNLLGTYSPEKTKYYSDLIQKIRHL